MAAREITGVRHYPVLMEGLKLLQDFLQQVTFNYPGRKGTGA